jgi:tetraacyldisaccharide 4'-kinase
MQAPSFWWCEAGLAARVLRPFSALYGAVAARRMRQPGARAAVPVVCIGDPTVGGAGKTPTAIAVARRLAAAGERPVFLTRGYGGRLGGPVLVDPTAHAADEVGDEPLLLARDFPTIVARDRVAGARVAAERRASVIVMDDGFQNPSLAKEFSVLVIDAARGLGNGEVFPAGPLRAPLRTQVERAHAVLSIGEGDAAAGVARTAAEAGLPLFRGRLVPEPDPLDRLRRRPVLAFAAIGNPKKFFQALTDAGVEVRDARPFADHHVYSQMEAETLLRDAAKDHLQLVTTEKDYVRLRADRAHAQLRGSTQVLPVSLVLDDADAFAALLLSRIRSA